MSTTTSIPAQTDAPAPDSAEIAAVGAIYAAFQQGDVPAILERLADDVSWDEGVRATDLPWLRPGRGKDHVVAFLVALGAGMEFTTFELVALTGSAGCVVGVVREAGRILSNGNLVEEDLFAHLWQFDAHGKVSSFRHIGDWARHEVPYRG